MIRRGALALAMVALLAGCASGREARVAARVVLAETLQYERLVDRKIAAEDAYYTNRVKALNQSLDDALDTAGKLDVALQANRAAADLVARPQRLAPADVVDFVTLVLRRQEEIFDGVTAKRQELRTLATESLVPLELDKRALQRTRKALESLQLAPDETARLKALYDFVKATRAQYDKLRREDAGDAK